MSAFSRGIDSQVCRISACGHRRSTHVASSTREPRSPLSRPSVRGAPSPVPVKTVQRMLDAVDPAVKAAEHPSCGHSHAAGDRPPQSHRPGRRTGSSGIRRAALAAGRWQHLGQALGRLHALAPRRARLRRCAGARHCAGQSRAGTPGVRQGLAAHHAAERHGLTVRRTERRLNRGASGGLAGAGHHGDAGAAPSRNRRGGASRPAQRLRRWHRGAGLVPAASTRP